MALSADYFMGLDAPSIDVTALAAAIFLLTALPVAAGMAFRHFAPSSSHRVDKVLSIIATVLFIVIVIGALASNWSMFLENFPRLAPASIALVIALLSIGTISGRILRLSNREATAIAIETGIQNGALGITVASLVAEQTAGLEAFSIPSAVYGITMYLVAAPFIVWRRRLG